MGRVIPFRNAQLLAELQRLLAQPRSAGELLGVIDEAVSARSPRPMDDPELESLLRQAQLLGQDKNTRSGVEGLGPIDVRFGPRTHSTTFRPPPGEWMEGADHTMHGGRRLYYNTRSGLGWDASVLDAWRPSEPFVRRRLMRSRFRPRDPRNARDVAKLLEALQRAIENP